MFLKIAKWAVIVIFVLAVLSAGFLVALTAYFPLRHSVIIAEKAEKYDLPEELIFAVIHTESRFRPQALSPRSASGLMQLMPATAYWIAGHIGMDDFDVSRINEPRINIGFGTWYLRWLYERFDGEMDTVLAAYNAGHNRVTGWLSDTQYSNDGRTLFHIPFTETRNYVERVNRAIPIYRFLLSVFGRFL